MLRRIREERYRTTEAHRHGDTRSCFVFLCAFVSPWFKKNHFGSVEGGLRTDRKLYKWISCLVTKLYLRHRMKIRACILLLIWSTLLTEPLSANFSIQSPYSSCSKKVEVQSSSCESKCNKPKDKEEENDCENNRCNPLMSCPTGNFYLFGHQLLSIAPFILSKQKAILINDNRIIQQLTECWHPPEII